MLSFHAKAKNGISADEARRREEIALASVRGTLPPARELPPAMPHFGGLAQALKEREDAEPPVEALAETEPVESVTLASVEVAASSERLRGFTPDDPVVTITVSGVDHAGKTSLVHLIRQALAYEGIAFKGPDNLISLRWHRSLDWHVRRGLSVVIVEETTEPPGAEIADG